jgi:hypothetical protein
MKRTLGLDWPINDEIELDKQRARARVRRRYWGEFDIGL